MSERVSDVARLKLGYAAFNRGGVSAIVDWLAPDIEISERQTLIDSGTYRGISGIAELFASNMEAFEQLEFEPEQFIDAGDDIIAVVRQRAVGRASGVAVEDVVAHRWTMRDGRPERLRMFGNVEKALAG
jgi:ketosteroid isomerase-like protein